LLSKCTSHSVSPEEIRYLAALFTDLSSRSSSNDALDKTTFLLFFPLPVRFIQGLWGERLFAGFDRRKAGKLTFDDFVAGLSICSKGTEEEKLRFLFGLYDLRQDGVIDRAELVAMVRDTQMHSTHRFVEEGNLSGVIVKAPDEDDRSPSSIHHQVPRHPERKSSAASIQRDDFTSEKAESIVGEIFTNLEAHNSHELDFHQFSLFMAQYPKVMDMFTRVFREGLWVVKSVDALSDLESPKTKSLDQNTKCCFGWCRSKSATFQPSLTQPDSASPRKDVKFGWLIKEEGDKPGRKVYVSLRNRMLLVYSKPSDAIPENVVFVEGCYVDVPDWGQENFPFVLVHLFETERKVCFYTVTEGDREDWVWRLKLVCKSRTFSDFYLLNDRIGTGRYSNVFSSTEIATGYTWAIKVIDKTRLDDNEREMLRSEIAIMRVLNSPYVVQMKELFEEKDHLYLVTELVEGGELFARILHKKVLSEYSCYHITKQLLLTVKYLHDVGIIHRDIKPENILLADRSELPVIKLADFGLSKLIGPEDLLYAPCGTLAYVAPEVLTQTGYTRKADLWSIGVVAYLMLRGKLPFDSKDKRALIEKTIEGKVEMEEEYWGKLTTHACDFIKKLLTKNVDERLSCDQALAHPWIRNGEIIIPRKINRRTLEEDLMRKTITNTKLQRGIYAEEQKANTIDPAEAADGRIRFTTPDIYEDMRVERRFAERSLL
jgi:serine/threonine protein kinase/Ca2+-binding EF-hand superfamily protein